MIAKNTITTYCSNDCPQLNQLKDQYQCLISKFSHEIRNPLTLIYSSIQLVEQDCPSVTESDLWPQIKQDIQDTIHLLQDVSTWNKSTKLNRTPVSVFHFLSKIAGSAAPLMKERGISFITNFDSSTENAEFFSDELKLKEVITNLLLNAADAVMENHSKNRLQGEITLSAEIIENQLIICVKDNGPGICDEYLSSLFEPFVTHKPQGTGLGLAIAKSIVEQHNGTISVSTCAQKPETFTEFSLKLPTCY